MKIVGYLWLVASAFIVGAGYTLIWQQSGFEMGDGVLIVLAFVPGIFLVKWASYRERAARRGL